MSRIVTVAEITARLVKIQTTDESEMPTEQYRLLILDACRFYGAANMLCAQVDGNRAQWLIARKATKSWADDFLVARHGVTRYWAHAATNEVTRQNLPPCEPGNMADFVQEPFYEAWLEVSAAAVTA